MSDSNQLALIVLAAILTGALLPLLVAATLLVGTLRKRAGEIGQRLAATLGHAESTLRRLDQVSAGLEGSDKEIRDLREVIGEVTVTARALHRNLRTAGAVAAALGPATAAFVRGLGAAAASSSPAKDQTTTGGSDE